MAPCPRDERGAALVVSLALVAVLLSVALAVAAVVDVLAARQRAAAAADLGALAGAPVASSSEAVACSAAERVVQANGATLRRCAVVDGDVRVSVSARPRAGWSRWLARFLSGAAEPVVDARAGLR